jgi:hypothetical protein
MIEEQIINTIDEIQSMLARALVRESMDQSMKIIEAGEKGRRLANQIGIMIEKEEVKKP